jgi:hypothetical protein
VCAGEQQLDGEGGGVRIEHHSSGSPQVLVVRVVLLMHFACDWQELRQRMQPPV